MALLIKTNNEVFHRSPADGFAFLPDEIEQHIGSHFTILEIGKLSALALHDPQDDTTLQVNSWATALAWRVLKQHEVIRGDVLFLKIKEID